MADPAEFPDVPMDGIITLVAIGFLVASVGHLYKAKWVIALGLILIVTAVTVLPLLSIAG